MSKIQQVVYAGFWFLAILGVRIFIERIPKSYGYFTLHKNYEERSTKIISINFDPEGINAGQCIVKHKMQINYKDIVNETSVYNKEIIQKLKNYKSGSGWYWIYYNPKNPDIFLVDFRDTTKEQKAVCEDYR